MLFFVLLAASIVIGIMIALNDEMSAGAFFFGAFAGGFIGWCVSLGICALIGICLNQSIGTQKFVHNVVAASDEPNHYFTTTGSGSDLSIQWYERGPDGGLVRGSVTESGNNHIEVFPVGKNGKAKVVHLNHSRNSTTPIWLATWDIASDNPPQDQSADQDIWKVYVPKSTFSSNLLPSS